MPISPFHAMYKAKMLSNYAFGRDRLLPVYASSDMKIFPYQVAAAHFAMRSPYLKGAILCDEGSLGKTYEALLVIAQSYYEGKDKIFLIVPTPLLKQWSNTISEHFTIPFFTIDSEETFAACQNDGQDNPFDQDGIILTTYDFAAEKAEYIKKIRWQLSVFDEAHRLRKIYAEGNKEANILRDAVGDSYKLLLTTTPMQNDIMDLFGLICFIDETVFPDADAFYKRYFRKPENYPELAERVSKYCFRTTRKQVQSYLKIPKRIPVSINYTVSG
ncbi:MAG: DEAD/DEAH box helicase, partial [Clostridiales bacterium]|nr:DEAD/DEAH box helicase [Clostridiales bacterium]